MLKTILLFSLLFFSVLGLLVFFLAVLLKVSSPGGRNEIFLVSLPGENDKEYFLRLRWLEAVLSLSGLRDRITVAAPIENEELIKILREAGKENRENGG